MPETAPGVPLATPAMYFSLAAVGAVIVGLLLVKPLLRLLIGGGTT